MKQKEWSTAKKLLQNSLKLQVKRIVKQEKRNKELSFARICKHNPKSFYSYINEKRIVMDNIEPLKTLDGIVITTDNKNGQNNEQLL